MFPNSVKYQCDLTSIPFSGSVKRFRRRQEPSLDFRLNFNQKRTVSRYFFEISGVILKRECLAALKIQPNGKSSVKNGDFDEPIRSNFGQTGSVKNLPIQSSPEMGSPPIIRGPVSGRVGQV